mmetsp:Transcript_31642/g.94293  ORF Transcript_31642/g.94293 Transcript_31642/m.94293 type:complete len:271 (-) Transcript_31642:241-1053(-)
MHACARDALVREERVQVLHVVPRRRKQNGGLVERDDLAHEVQQRAQLLLGPHSEERQLQVGADLGVGVQPHQLRALEPCLRKLSEALRHRRAEEQRLPLLRRHPDDLVDLFLEAHLEQPVGLIQHQHRQVLQPHTLRVPQMVDQPAGRRHNDLRAPPQHSRLDLRRQPAYNQGRMHIGVLRQLSHHAVHLYRELSGGRQHQHVRCCNLLRPVQQPLQHGQRKRRRLARPRDRAAAHVAPRERERHARCLDRGGRLEAKRRDRLEQRPRQI